MTGVSNLLLSSGPSAIFWAIPKIIINPVKREAGRAISHVRMEIRKLFPSVANSDPAKNVIFILGAARGPDSPPHCHPTTVRAGIGANRMPMLGEISAYNLFVEAAA